MTDQTTPPALDLAALTVIANAATPGPWDHHSFGSTGDDEPRAIIVHAGDFDWQAINAGDYVVATPRWDADEDMNARHIAAFDPPTVLALIARLENAEALYLVRHNHVLAAEDDRNQWRARAEAAEAKIAAVRAIADKYRIDGGHLCGDWDTDCGNCVTDELTDALNNHTPETETP